MNAIGASSVATDRFVQTLVMVYEVLVLLPGGNEIIGESVEDLVIDLGLRRVKGVSDTV